MKEAPKVKKEAFYLPAGMFTRGFLCSLGLSICVRLCFQLLIVPLHLYAPSAHLVRLMGSVVFQLPFWGGIVAGGLMNLKSMRDCLGQDSGLPSGILVVGIVLLVLGAKVGSFILFIGGAP